MSIIHTASEDDAIDDMREEWESEDRDIEGRKPRLDETEEDEAGE